ncbi:serine kinase [Luteolibacter sp. SL250]|uniref:DUF7336 domain-containing protein n=1 Tax=Luteolibacter sp. SL250 TaxID=2995170 RepID=UPI002270BD8C|nr:serine kinase [Luteolibacter sp. SL250]WAC21349.1 serine kinase [Luteolibacter sp. SL250]
MESVFVVQHLNILNEDEDQVKMIGVYRSHETAVAAVERLKIQPGFCEHPRIVDTLEDEDRRGFYVEEYALDQDHWREGYVTETYPID